jgi:hypothetical protein
MHSCVPIWRRSRDEDAAQGRRGVSASSPPATGPPAGEDFQLLLTRYANERLLVRLAASRHNSQFVLKGAALFTVWTDPEGPGSSRSRARGFPA